MQNIAHGCARGGLRGDAVSEGEIPPRSPPQERARSAHSARFAETRYRSRNATRIFGCALGRCLGGSFCMRCPRSFALFKERTSRGQRDREENTLWRLQKNNGLGVLCKTSRARVRAGKVWGDAVSGGLIPPQSPPQERARCAHSARERNPKGYTRRVTLTRSLSLTKRVSQKRATNSQHDRETLNFYGFSSLIIFISLIIPKASRLDSLLVRL